MTKSEYRKYIQSEYWQKRRKKFLSAHYVCQACRIPHFAAVLAYDQGFHVHHVNYQNLGHEEDADLMALCRRCHEIETFGKSSLAEAGEWLEAPYINDYLNSRPDIYGEGFNDAYEWIIYMDRVRRKK